MAAACLLGASYCLGGLHGLHMAWTQPARMKAWAARVELAAERAEGLVPEPIERAA